MRRPITALGVALALVAVACSGDDDDAAETTAPPDTTAVVDTTDPAPTDPPPATTEPPLTTAVATTTTPPSTTISEEALKAQIAVDYVRSWELFDELATNPTPDGLDAALAHISAPGSENYTRKRQFVEELLASGERVVNGDPDYSTVEVERVELLGSPPYESAQVTFCSVNNRVRIDSNGAVLSEGLVAARRSEGVIRTPNGWLPNGSGTETWAGLEVTNCPPE